MLESVKCRLWAGCSTKRLQLPPGTFAPPQQGLPNHGRQLHHGYACVLALQKTGTTNNILTAEFAAGTLL